MLLALLVLHFLAREQTGKTMPRSGGEFYRYSNGYPVSYQVSLGLVAGKGLCRLTWPAGSGDAGHPDGVEPCPEAKPLVEFLNFQRPRVSREEFQAFLNAPLAGTAPVDSWEFTRILDIYLTAFVWKVFGISWTVYYIVASLASTLSCFLVFLVARRLSGSYWAGLLAALLFFASPFENHFAIRSVRDISPLWFATGAFAFFICAVDNFRSRKWNYLSFLVLGLLAMIGRGWRLDVLLLVPFLFVALIVFLAFKRHGWKHILAGATLFLLGCWSADRFVRSLWPSEEYSSGTVYHMAYYGDSSRCNLMGLENSFQINRDDFQTWQDVNRFDERRTGDLLVIGTKEYAAACREIYVCVMKYHLFQYVSLWPKFYIQALGAFPESDCLQGESLSMLRQSRLAWTLPFYDWGLDYLTTWLPYLHLLGIATLFLTSRDKIRGAFLVLFSLYYSVIWLAVLPEQKHLGQLLLPLTVTGGLGLWGLARFARFMLFGFHGPNVSFTGLRSLRVACGVGLAALICWVAACALTYRYSLRHRDNYVNEIRALAARGVEAPETIKDARVFSAYFEPNRPLRPTGFLLAIQTSANPGYLTCRHMHFPAKPLPSRLSITRHKLLPDKVQYFAVSCFAGRRDQRPYAYTVTLNAGCRIIWSKKFDLSSWERLPFSMLFHDGEKCAGSPEVGRFPSGNLSFDPFLGQSTITNLSSEMGYDIPSQSLSVLGLPWDENFVYPGLLPARVVASFEAPGPRRLRPPTNLDELNELGLPLSNLGPEDGATLTSEARGLNLKVLPGQSGNAATYSPIIPSEDGVYLFQMRYRRLAGELSLHVDGSRKKELLQRTFLTVQGDGLVQSVEVKLKAGESFQLRLANQAPPGYWASEFLIQEMRAYREKYPLWESIRRP